MPRIGAKRDFDEQQPVRLRDVDLRLWAFGHAPSGWLKISLKSSSERTVEITELASGGHKASAAFISRIAFAFSVLCASSSCHSASFAANAAGGICTRFSEFVNHPHLMFSCNSS
jgi:hypothetical protein